LQSADERLFNPAQNFVWPRQTADRRDPDQRCFPPTLRSIGFSLSRGHDPKLQDRLQDAAEARRAMLAKFKTASAPDNAALIEKQRQRQEIAAARAERAAQREAKRQEEERERARLAAEAERAAAEAARIEAERVAREAAEQAEREAALKAEQKAARDERYAARKAAKKARRKG
jgi:uncharacterized protein DUF6481